MDKKIKQLLMNLSLYFFLPVINLLTKLAVPNGCVNGKNNDV